jgi:hypothetical protein
MKSNQHIKGYALTAATNVEIQGTYNAPIIAIQNQGTVDATIILNDGEPMVLGASPFMWEPYTPLLGRIYTDSADVVVFA